MKVTEPTPFDQKLDEILWSLEDDYRPGEADFVDKQMEEAKQQIKYALRGAVGEDEPEPSYEALSAGVSAGAGYRNQEKQRIRKELGL